jgi:PAS domain S-box-containing protein
MPIPQPTPEARATSLAERLAFVLKKGGLEAWSMDLVTGKMTVASGARAWFGTQGGRTVHRTGWLEALHEEDRETLRGCLDRAGLGAPLSARYRLAGNAGHWFWVEGMAAPDATTGRAELFGLVGEVRVSGPAFWSAMPRLSSHTDAQVMPLLSLARCDPDLRLRWVSASYAERLGHRPEDLRGQPMAGRLGADAFAILEPHLRRALRGEEVVVEIELPWAPRDGRQITLAVIPEADASGSIAGLIVLEADLTEAKHAQRALYRREREFQTIVENSPDIVARLDREARHLYINRAAEEPFGLGTSDFLGKTMAELGIAAPVAEAYRQATAGVFESGLEQSFNFSLEVGKAVRHYTARAIPELDPKGEIESVLIVTYDVTQRTQAQRERDALLVREQTARVQAEAAARARDEFLAIVSHELRSPLNGIQSWTHVLENYISTESAAVVRALAGIKLGVQQQVRLIEDLLDATRIMTGKLKLVRRPLEIGPVLQSAIDSVRPLATEKSITIASRLGGPEDRVDGDSDRLQQIFVNLLSNAVKFTPSSGHVWVEVAPAAPETEIEISVRDDGRGIAAEFLPFLFDPFRQADGSSTRRAGGIGLGLTLARSLTELHGGRLTADSPGADQGARFCVVLPRASGSIDAGSALPAVSTHPHGTLASLHGRRVTLIDDQREARDSLAELLEQAGAEVHPFASGADVVAHFRLLAPAERPDVLICDIAMPEEDGYLTLQRIRSEERARPREGKGEIPAVALTAFSQREDRVRAMASGFQVHLAKPVDPAELIAVIQALAQSGVAGHSAQVR